MPSVIIPACNEENVIGRCVSALVDDAAPNELEVIVVCNGCSDGTAAAARRCGSNVTVIETPVASKIHALNIGDRAANRFPRFYVDADVVLTMSDLRRLAERLDAGKLAVAPRPEFDLTDCSWFVRAFYQINAKLPSSREGIGGSGVYGLSEAGRKRFESFPDVIADDGFVRLQFTESERQTVQDCCSTVFAPRTLAQLVRIKTRSHLGTMQLRRSHPDLWQNRGASNGTTLSRLAKNPVLWPSLLAYCFVKLVARLRATKRLRTLDFGWERDNTSRKISSTAAAEAPSAIAAAPCASA